eukprot:2085220-Amphidinium_carterae.1
MAAAVCTENKCLRSLKRECYKLNGSLFVLGNVVVHEEVDNLLIIMGLTSDCHGDVRRRKFQIRNSK